MPISSSAPYVAVHVGPWIVPHLERFLERPVRYRPFGTPGEASAIIGWGYKGVALEAQAAARRHGLPYLALEDGFLRSIGLGDRDPALSLVLDDLGIYYSAEGPSRLERLIASPHDDAQRARARGVAAAWRDGRLSKYNHAREAPPPVTEPFVLVVDQTAGDASIRHGLADAQSFERMLEAALDEHPGRTIVLKVHPDVIAGRKRAHFGSLTPGQAERVRILSDNAHPPGLLQHAEAVYVVTSQMGFEALLWGKPVRSFGMPFYAGWGLSRDELPAPERRRSAQRVGLEDLVHAALVEYPRYLDPETLARCEVERLMAWMALQRRMRERFAPQLDAVGFGPALRTRARAFFAGSELRFVDHPAAASDAAPAALWCDGATQQAEPPPTQPLVRVVGGLLDALLPAPAGAGASWLMDRSGRSDDGTRSSDLEELLQTAEFDAALCRRARALRERLVAAWSARDPMSGDTQPVVLVVGEPDDAGNLTRLAAAHAASPPGSRVVYLAEGSSLKAPAHADVPAWASARGVIVAEAATAHGWLQRAGVVHVRASLAGFGALLRGARVVCAGQPFYAGWSLTTDAQPFARRRRALTLDQLVAGALILYPAYLSRRTGAFTTPERALEELLQGDRSTVEPEPGIRRALRAIKRRRDRWRRP